MTSDEIKETIIIPPAPPEPGDSRLDTFLQKAAPVIAVERGINAKSRVKLEAIARDMRLPDDLFEQGIHMLQGAPPVEKGHENRWTEAFRQYLHAKLENLPRKILTFRMEARVIAVAASKFQLSEDEARDVVRIVAKEHEIRRVSQSEAERYVAHLIHKKVGEAAWLDDNTVTRLHAVGNEWGLSAEQVDAVIRQFTYENRQRQERERRNTVITLTIAAIVVVGLLCGIVFMVYQSKKTDPSDDVADSRVDDKQESDSGKRPTPRRVNPPAWWDDDLTINIARCRVDSVNLAGFGKVYLQIASDDPAHRADGYAELVKLSGEVSDQSDALGRLSDIIVRCHTLDPDDECASVLAEELLNFEALAADELPADEQHYDRVLRSTDIALNMLQHDRLADARAQSLEQSLGGMLEMSISRKDSAPALRQKMNQALLGRFYRQLTIAGPKHVAVAHQFYEPLTKLGQRFLDPKALDRFEAEFMSAIVPAAGGSWRRYEKLIQQCIYAHNNNGILDVLELLVNSKEKELQDFIAVALVKHLDLSPPSMSPEDVVSAVRSELGIKVPTVAETSRDRWEKLQELVDKTLAAALSGRMPKDLLQRTVELSYLTTLALALAQQDPGFPIFDQLIEDGLPDLSSSKKADSHPFRADGGERVVHHLGVIATKRQKLGEYLTRMRYPARIEQPTRLFLMREIAKLPDYLEDISTDQANVLVYYLMANKDDEEVEKTLPQVTRLAKWNRFLLALADTLTEHDVEASDNNQRVLSAALGSGVRIGNDVPNWQQKIRHKLMQKVAAKTEGPRRVAANDPIRVIENATDALRQLYATRAKLLGVPLAEYGNAKSPSAALNLLVSRRAETASGPSASKLLADLPHRLTIVDFLGDNDLRRTALLQRLWLDLVAVEVARKQPARATEVGKLVSELQGRDAHSSSVVDQLLDGELSSLKAWMLLAP